MPRRLQREEVGRSSAESSLYLRGYVARSRSIVKESGSRRETLHDGKLLLVRRRKGLPDPTYVELHVPRHELRKGH